MSGKNIYSSFLGSLCPENNYLHQSTGKSVPDRTSINSRDANVGTYRPKDPLCVCVCVRERERERGPGHIPDQISETHHQNSQPCWPSSSNSSLAYH